MIALLNIVLGFSIVLYCNGPIMLLSQRIHWIIFPWCQKFNKAIHSGTDLGIRLRRASDARVVARYVSWRRENTGRQRQVVRGWCSTASRRLRWDDLSATELTATLSASTRYADTCWQPLHGRPTSHAHPSIALAVNRSQLWIHTHKRKSNIVERNVQRLCYWSLQ